MIDIDTVFILGAGASNPYKYPTGKGLREYIFTTFKKNFPVVYQKSGLPGKIADWETETNRFCNTFKKSSTRSIDLFLARHQNFSDIGKIAIILSIFDAEYWSKFREDINEPNKDWYSYLYHRMTERLIGPDSYKNFGNNNVAFITFNYDRSFEQFLYESLTNSFSNAPKEEIIKEIKKIQIHHVYGKIIDLPWENNQGDTVKYFTENDKPPYHTFSLDKLMKWSSNIKLIQERSKQDCLEMINTICKAKKIYFLGFGYARENLEILELNRNLNESQKIYGTAYGLLGKEIKDIRVALSANFPSHARANTNPHYPNPTIEKDMDCVTLLREFL